MDPTEREDIVSANESFNKWCNTKGINFYEGIEALGNLFRYAVPKLDYWYMSQEKFTRVGAGAQYNGIQSGVAFNEDHALALFWAIYSIITSEEQMFEIAKKYFRYGK